METKSIQWDLEALINWLFLLCKTPIGMLAGFEKEKSEMMGNCYLMLSIVPSHYPTVPAFHHLPHESRMKHDSDSGTTVTNWKP